ncbi:hypothetical protein C8F04DRAFT_1281464 [Mycena alexandri]|uniref:Uncharacterized protein n=1 Tax=Mycena alexandri TaxID=1745969 RepID=A0AAD6RY36_9AGAR|nr:hypothetical protein C8F04DRAFT_1281464 [Mycena alexandri]
MTAGTTGTSPSSTVNPLWFAVKKNRAFFAFAWPILIFFSLFAALFEAQRQNILQNRTDAQIIVINRDAWLPTELSNWYPWEATTPACSTQWKKWRCWQPCFFAGGPEGIIGVDPSAYQWCMDSALKIVAMNILRRRGDQK